MLNRVKTVGASILLATVLGGCAIGPNYFRPALAEGELPGQWQGRWPHAGDAQILTQWWAHFDDPTLLSLIAQAQDSSPTVAEAAARVTQSRLALRTANAATMPQLQLMGSQVQQAERGEPSRQTQSTVLDVSWELDLYGARYREQERAQARYQGAAANWHNARVSLAAEVAAQYIAYQKCRLDVQQLGKIAQSREMTASRTQARQAAGFLSAADTARGANLALEGQSAHIQMQGVCDRQVNGLVRLTGVPKQDLSAQLDSSSPRIPRLKNGEGLELPAQDLRQRPDVRAAEAALMQATAAIGIAQADALPSLTLKGSLGQIAVQAAGTALQVSNPWSFGPTLVLPLLDGQRKQTAIATARAQAEEALAGYRGVVRKAVQEAEDALSRVGHAQVLQRNALAAVNNANLQWESTEKRYAVGLISGLDREDAFRAQAQSTLNLYNAQQELAQSWVALYKALGGGWAAQHDYSQDDTR